MFKKDSIYKGFFKKDKKHGIGIKQSNKSIMNDKFENKDKSNQIILVGNWLENSLEGIAIGINMDNHEVEKMYKFSENKLKSSTTDINTINEKMKTNKDCLSLLEFFKKHKDKQ